MSVTTNTSHHRPLIDALYSTLQGRHRPEDVARDILALFNDGAQESARNRHERWFTPAASLSTSKEVRLLRELARGASNPSWMPTTFDAPVPLHKQTTTLCTLLGVAPLDMVEAGDPVRLRALIHDTRRALAVEATATSFPHDRVPRDLRATYGVKLGRRAYNKVFRLMTRLESEVEELERQYEVFRLTRLAKTSFAANVPRDAFVASDDGAAFVAYMTATLGRRSQFTNGKQTRAFDDVAAALLKRCERSASTNWFAVAHVFPRADVLARLTESERFELLGRALDALQRSAHLLRWLYERSATVFNLDTMVVRSGMDSTTWNSIAGAWNRARDSWLALTESLGMDDTFDTFMPGKVLRLMAADVMVWHRASGGEKHGDTGVWSLLPKPWEVVLDRADGITAPDDLRCGRADIERACHEAGVDAEATGWTRARPRTSVAAMKFTPELVQGVTVSDPQLAAWLRRIGAWRGNTPLRTPRAEARS